MCARVLQGMCVCVCDFNVGGQGPRKNSGSHIDASHSRQPLVKGERLVRYEVNAVMIELHFGMALACLCVANILFVFQTLTKPAALP